MNLKVLVTLAVVLMVGDGESGGDETRLKLCGREFIRMVVTSCGSSRLRRSAPEPNTIRQMFGEDDGSSVENRTAGTRTPRNAGPAGVCCRSGCTMSELVQYC
ncbi:insulin-like 3 (Leydig cell) [Astyanax mexicanus]|uniref:Insulin-like 3 n=1 Tax=Astyanax mexicanus TaxID=7994 RepID=A0A8B9I173_ASTMX|nr:insulin-like 3 (Leydig cell) [Astyanax mexicanus]KAG9278894.1 relaxin-3-like [Astyanax mexicanus]